jgi:Raf kinase inhibitor-like YbhB/YbcL family protein
MGDLALPAPTFDPSFGCVIRGGAMDAVCREPAPEELAKREPMFHLAAEERAMKLVSSAFADGAAIPRRFTCDGENLSPPLQWSSVPEGSRSYVLLCDDPDAPAGTWHHWAVYDIPAAVTELAVNGAQNTKMKQAVNDFRKVGYGGPCPPHGHGPHHYHFRLLALSMADLPVNANASCRDIEREARKHVIAEAMLVGWYER